MPMCLFARTEEFLAGNRITLSPFPSNLVEAPEIAYPFIWLALFDCRVNFDIPPKAPRTSPPNGRSARGRTH